MSAEDLPKRWQRGDDPLSYRIIGAAIEVHRLLGPRLVGIRIRRVPVSRTLSPRDSI
jgi:hypothetical protein